MRRFLLAFALPGLLWAQGALAPAWIQTLPQQPGRIYGLGLASLGASHGQALDQASQNARVEVLARLRASIKAETNINSSSTVQTGTATGSVGSSQQQVAQVTRISTQAQDLPGLGLEATWLDGPGRTAYALAYLEVGAAMRALSARFAQVRADLGQDPNPPGTALRDRLIRLQRLRSNRDELARLDDLAALLDAAGGDPALRAQISQQHSQLSAQLEALRGSVSLGLQGLDPAPELAALARRTAAGLELGWADQNPDLILRIQPLGDPKGWDLRQHRTWSYQPSPDFTVAKGGFQVTLLDRAGTRYEALSLEVTGLGTSTAGADRALLKDTCTRLEPVLLRWLTALAR